MGCVSSKVVKRSRSFQEELSLSFSLQRRTNGLPGLEDLVASKNGGGDQLLALLCTANTVAAKLRAGNAAGEQGKPSPCPTEPEHDEEAAIAAATAAEEPTIPETINTWELMADLEQEEEQQGEQEQGQQQQQNLLRHPQELADSRCLKDGDGVSRSRSFRTVEDFDAMVAGNSSTSVEAWLDDSHEIPSKDDPPPDSSKQAQIADDASGEQDHEEEDRTGDGNAHQVPDGPDGSDCSRTKVTPELLPDVDSVAFPRSSTTRAPGASAEVNGIAGARSFVEQKGLRRRAMARELRALKVPLKVPSFEFSSVGSLREWLGGGGQVFSPGSYVTPKFGNFGSPDAAAAIARGGDAGEEEAPFDPQLVADLGEAMERLTMEEEHILRQIVESLQGSHEEDSDILIFSREL